jgi:hypothetical protein
LVRANLTGPIRFLDPHTVHTIAGHSGNFWFDPTSFTSGNFPDDSQAVSDPAVRTYGTLPRNAFRGPGPFNINLAFSKTTPLADRLRMEFRADFFNLLNHTEFSNPDTNISDKRNFGKILNTFSPRILQFALRFTF